MERIVAQIVEIVKRKHAKELVDRDDLKKVEKAFTRITETYYYQRTHYCEDSDIIKYTYRTKERYDVNKSYIDRIQTTIPDYYMNKKILENKDIIY